jgi:ATP-binding cassette subfamily C protein
VAFVNSWLLSLIFLIASFIPAVFQNIFGPKIEQNSTTWEKQNSQYTETVGETIRGLRVINLYDVQNTFVGGCSIVLGKWNWRSRKLMKPRTLLQK